MGNHNTDVTSFLDEQNHPFRKEIEQLRNCILSTSNNLTENIKWNGPNYCFDNKDRITMRIQPPPLGVASTATSNLTRPLACI